MYRTRFTKNRCLVLRNQRDCGYIYTIHKTTKRQAFYIFYILCDFVTVPPCQFTDEPFCRSTMPECNRNMCMCVKKARPLIRQSDSMFAGNSHQPTQHNYRYGQLPPVVVASTCLLVTNLNEVASTSFCHGITFAKELFFAHPSAFAAPCS